MYEKYPLRVIYPNTKTSCYCEEWERYLYVLINMYIVTEEIKYKYILA